MEMAFGTVAVVCIDLRAMWAKLHVLHWVAGEVVPQLTTALHITAGLGFIEGEYCGQGLPQIHFFARPLEAWRVEPPQEAAGDDGEDEKDEEDDSFRDDGRQPAERHRDHGRRLDAVQRRAEHFTAGSVLALSLAAQDVAQDLVNTWEALGRFCRTRVGVSPETILAAWGFPVAGEFEQTLKRYAHLKPQPEKVKEYTHYICVNWDRLYGRRRHESDDGGETPEMEGCDGV
jgi:hypothetical protein